MENPDPFCVKRVKPTTVEMILFSITVWQETLGMLYNDPVWKHELIILKDDEQFGPGLHKPDVFYNFSKLSHYTQNLCGQDPYKENTLKFTFSLSPVKCWLCG